MRLSRFYISQFLLVALLAGVCPGIAFAEDGDLSGTGDGSGDQGAGAADPVKPPPPPKPEDTNKAGKPAAAAAETGTQYFGSGNRDNSPANIGALNASSGKAASENDKLNKKFEDKKIDPAYFMVTKMAMTKDFLEATKQKPAEVPQIPVLAMDVPKVNLAPVGEKTPMPELAVLGKPGENVGATGPSAPSGGRLSFDEKAGEVSKTGVSLVPPVESSVRSIGSGDPSTPAVKVTEQAIKTAADTLDSIHSMAAEKKVEKADGSGTSIVSVARGIAEMSEDEQGDLWSRLSPEEKALVQEKIVEIQKSLEEEVGEEEAVAKIEELKIDAKGNPSVLANLMGKVRDEILVSKGKAPRSNPIVFTKAAGVSLEPVRSLASVKPASVTPVARESGRAGVPWKLFASFGLLGVGLLVSRRMRRSAK